MSTPEALASQASDARGVERVLARMSQGLGRLTYEELVNDSKGVLNTHSPDTHKVLAMGEAPPDFRVDLLKDAAQGDVIYGSEAVGELPCMPPMLQHTHPCPRLQFRTIFEAWLSRSALRWGPTSSRPIL